MLLSSFDIEMDVDVMSTHEVLQVFIRSSFFFLSASASVDVLCEHIEILFCVRQVLNILNENERTARVMRVWNAIDISKAASLVAFFEIGLI